MASSVDSHFWLLGPSPGKGAGGEVTLRLLPSCAAESQVNRQAWESSGETLWERELYVDTGPCVCLCACGGG